MAYSVFNTKNAKYLARLGSHRKSSIKPEEVFDRAEGNKEGVYEPVDAIMLEVRGSQILKAGSLEKVIPEISKGNLQKEDKDVFDYARKKNIPIYIVEPEINKKDYARFWANIAPEIIPTSLLGFYSSPNENKKIPYLTKKIAGLSMFTFQNHIGAGRNAVWAKKLEEYIAPKLREKLGRKPKIGVNIGLAHVGLEDDLKKPWRRNFTLKNWEKFNLGRYSGMNYGKNIGRIYKLTPKDEEEWDIEKIETDLFNEDHLKKAEASVNRKNLENYIGSIFILAGLLILLRVPSISGFVINTNSLTFNTSLINNFTIGIVLMIMGCFVINLQNILMKIF